MNEIRIISVELENYRQYYGKQKINFSSREEGFTIIAGKNGEGKSNLLNAILWCLYHEEPHGKKTLQGQKNFNASLPIINTRYILDLDEGQKARTSVKIQLKVGEDTYSISRILEILKHKLEFIELINGQKIMKVTEYLSDRIPSGCEIMEDPAKNFVIKKKGKDDLDFHTINISANVKIEEILPRGLAKYFLLDGEFLEEFWKDTTVIKDGIEQISQLHLVSSLMEHVDKLRIPTKGVSADTDKLTTKIEQLKWYTSSIGNDGNIKFSEDVRWKQNPDEEDIYYHASGTPRILDLKEDIKKMDDRISVIISRIPNINIPSMEMLQKQYVILNKRISEKQKEIESSKKTYGYNLVTKGPCIFLKESIENTVKIIESRMELGDLPIKQRKQFAEDLLKRGTCVCGEELNSKIINQKETNSHRINLEHFKNDLAGKGDLDTAVDMRYDLKHDFIDKYSDFLRINFGEWRENLVKSEKELDDLSKELQDVQVQLKSSKIDEVSDLIEERKRLQEQIQTKNEEIYTIQLDLKDKSALRSELSVTLEKALKKKEKAKKMLHELKVWQKIYTYLEIAYDELSEDIRINVQNNTWKNFQELLANPSEFEDFVIEPDYSVHLTSHVINKDGEKMTTNKVRDLSAGQSLILTLAFVAALREPTGYKFPLVIDSPLGKIDSTNKRNIANHLPKYLPEEQLILLVTNTEYTAYLPPDPDHPNLSNDPFAKLLNDKISLKHLIIQKEKTGDNVGNSRIKDAKLEFIEDEGYLVKEIV